MDARDRLHAANLRATGARVDVVDRLAEAGEPLAQADLAAKLGDMDRVTLYRNLHKLADAGLIREISGRYELADAPHPHFVCDDCGDIECLPKIEVELDDPRWGQSVAQADVQLNGRCPDCRE